MPFFIAWLRALAFFSFLFFLPVVASREDHIFTSSVTYCDPPETLLIQHFHVAYFARNHSVAFNISAASVKPNVNVSANLYLNVYGMNPVNVTIDLCSILNGALCPLPMYNFTGADTLVLPEKLGVASQIPKIAYKMPDLEAFAQLTLVEVGGTNNLKACVQATLSNGWSTHQSGVEWATVGIAIFAFISAVWQSIWSDALAPFRLLDLFYLYQSIATTSLLSINYPSVYRSFTLNFAWAMGLVSSPSSSIQISIDNMRHLTGGKMADTSTGSGVGLINRKLSPYNLGQTRLTIPSQDGVSDGFDTRLLNTFLASTNLPDINAPQLRVLASDAGPATVTTASPNVLQAGVPIFTNSIHIGTANAFMTVFLVSLILIAVILALFATAFLALFMIDRFQWSTPQRRHRLRAVYTPFVIAWTLRLVLIIFAPLLIFAFFQWTLKDSWLSVFLAVLTFLSLFTFVAFVSQIVFRFARRNSPSALYSDDHFAASYGPLFAQFRPQRFYFGTALLIAAFLRSIVIAAVHGHGQTQVILFVIIEGFLLLTLLVLRPHHTRGADVFSVYLGITRFLCTGLLIAFVEGLRVKAIPRVVIGVIVAVIFSVAILVTLIVLVLHSGVHRLWRRRSANEAQSLTSGSSNFSFVDHEKKAPSPDVGSSGSSATIARPSAPTPELSATRASGQQLFAMSPSTPSSAGLSSSPSSWQSSAFHSSFSPPGSAPSSRSSDLTTLGSVLPRRWSIEPSSPPLLTPSSVATEPEFATKSTAPSPSTSKQPSPSPRQSSLSTASSIPAVARA